MGGGPTTPAFSDSYPLESICLTVPALLAKIGYIEHLPIAASLANRQARMSDP